MQPLPPAWDPERDEVLTCVAVRVETHDVSTFVFAPQEPRLFRFLPGQFMTFDLDGAGVQRSYTIASAPTCPWRIEVTAKRSPGGAGSGWLHGALRPGVQVRASGPVGDFVLEPGAGGGKYLFLSAGSGITPLMSMARTLHDLGSDADVLFLHSARSPADLLFPEELAAMGRRPGFRSVSIVEGDAPGARWDGLRGRLSPAILGLVAPDLGEREVFCCGPAPYMAGVRAMLDAAGFDRARYREESFSFGEDVPDDLPAPAEKPALRSAERGGDLGAARPDAGQGGNIEKAAKPGAVARQGGMAVAAAVLPGALLSSPVPQREGGVAARAAAPEPGAPPQPAPDAQVGNAPGLATFTVRFARQNRDVFCPGGTSVLAAARAAGIRLPSACGKGVCGTCKTRVVSGTVEMKHGGGIRQREIDGGMALLCCARPTSDLVVDR